MGVHMRFGLLADYAAPGQGNKLVIIHTFDRFAAAPDRVGKPMGAGFLVARLECSIADGSAHRLVIRLLDDDEVQSPPEIEIEEIVFGSAGAGLPLVAQLVIPLGGIPVPAPGDYKFVVHVDGIVAGDIPLRFVASPSASNG